MLTLRDQDTLVEYIRDVADQLGLTEWEFLLSDEPTKHEDAWAHIDFVDGRRYASIYLCEDFRELHPDKQRHTVIHELLHCHFEMGMQAMKTALYEVLDKDQGLVQAIFIKNVTHHVELQTDLLARVLGKFFAFINWNTDATAEAEVDQSESGEAVAESAGV